MKRIRILHTADIHLDSAFTGLGVDARIGNALREAQRRVFSRIVERARDWPAHALFIAGDLFDNSSVRGETVAFVLESLEQLASIPVFIAPGNRDPYTDNSPYALELWPENVTVFSPGAWQQREHPTQPLTVHGIGCDGADDSGAWFKNLRITPDGRVHVAVAHGTERAHQPADGKCFAPFDAADIAQDHLTYLALGHFHNDVEVHGNFDTVMRYPGPPQGRTFAESGARGFLEVELECDDATATVARVSATDSAEILFTTYSCDCSGAVAPDAILDHLLAGEERAPDTIAARLEITGTPVPPLFKRINAIEAAARQRFFHTETVNAVAITPDARMFSGYRTCLANASAAMDARIADATEHEAAAFEAYARDLALSAAANDNLSCHEAEGVQA